VYDFDFELRVTIIVIVIVIVISLLLLLMLRPIIIMIIILILISISPQSYSVQWPRCVHGYFHFQRHAVLSEGIIDNNHHQSSIIKILLHLLRACWQSHYEEEK